ncbi:MAG: hypothetical protein MnENMB40S_12260 [Rhizobiaceae bacterium MnEN-MB40S]|nr:MAG: hypothetical protein MnENMB40S_12260 [Rhizobiaceae bacterium MnEN-MB40S]
MRNKKPEGVTYEEKAQIEWSAAGKQFDLLKTIVAFANCDGGELCILEFIGDERMLDSARLHDFVSKYVNPPVNEIVSLKAEDGSWTITIDKSATAPHVIKETGNYNNAGKQRPAFHPGQVYVRHSSKSEPAKAEDLQRLIREGVSSWLSSLGEAVARVGIMEDGTDKGIPMRLVADGPALELSFKDNFPYSAAELGKPFGKTAAWIGKLVNKEGMRDDAHYCRRHDIYANPIYAFSDAAMERIAEILGESPDYNPYKKG